MTQNILLSSKEESIELFFKADRSFLGVLLELPFGANPDFSIIRPRNSRKTKQIPFLPLHALSKNQTPHLASPHLTAAITLR